MPTHGSLTKAGKVRAQTPKIEPIPHTNPNPKKRNRTNFVKRIVHAPRDTRGRNQNNRY
ncbi:30S ribosomal protein S30e [Candidatus Bathyarchaeota archaeon]|nr:30S ribosomal protein S30e [Candidatus Bathyarchaeota archaeon]